MNVLVLGAGAVGLSLAAKLSEVCEVYAVCRKRHADAIRERGFHMTGIWGERDYRFACGEDAPGDMDYDYIFISTKSIDTESVCQEFAEVIGGREVISLQNGIGNEEIIAGYSDHVIGGTIITGFEWRGDAAVHVSVEAAAMKLGRFPEGADEKVERLVDLLKSAGMRAEVSPTIRSDLWSKTLYNCALNPLSAVMEVEYGKLADPYAWCIITGIVREAYAVAGAEGVHLPWTSAEGYLTYLHDVQLPATAHHHSSMLQDLRRGRETEIEFMNGAVVSRGRQYDVLTPYNAFITDLIHFREALQKG